MVLNTMSIVTIFGHKKIINFPTAFDVGLHLELNLKLFWQILNKMAVKTKKFQQSNI